MSNAENTSTHIRIGNSDMEVSRHIHDLVVREILPDLGMDPGAFWAKLEDVITEMTPKNNILLLKRYQLQASIDTWHQSRCDSPHNHDEYKKFLQKIGYLLPEGSDFAVSTDHVDEEITTIAGPQLVVPVKNARFALNAANARWGSLYDALYGTDVISEEEGAEKGKSYNPARGEKVFAYARAFLDEAVPLREGSHSDVVDYIVEDQLLKVVFTNGDSTGLKHTGKFAGYNGRCDAPSEIYLKNNNLHIILQVDPSHPIGKDDLAHIKDVILESAVTTIQDCEDSVAAADGEDKAEVYRNWLGLMRGTR